MLRGNYTPSEKAFLSAGLPAGIYLRYDTHFCNYVFEVNTQKGHAEILKVPREIAVRYRNPKAVFNYLARRALLKHGIADHMKRTAKD